MAEEDVALLEINISCPNVKAGGIAFGQDPKQVEKITAQIKAVAKQPVIMKLSPNVTDITEIAKYETPPKCDVKPYCKRCSFMELCLI